MKIFDFNIHLPPKQSADVNEVIADDLSLTIRGLESGLTLHAEKIKHANGINVLLFNQELFSDRGDISTFCTSLRTYFNQFMLTALVDFRKSDVRNYLSDAFDQGVNAIMFNSYLQKIEQSDFNLVLDACRFAEERGKIICIDGSYGTSKMFQFDNMKLACFIADHITKVPIIIIHSGGYRVMEAMLLAADKRNVILDTSFSLNYYLGSSLEQDYAFVYKRLGQDRVVFGSDIPYVDFTHVFGEQRTFFDKYGFSAEWQQRIFHDNAARLAHGEW